MGEITENPQIESSKIKRLTLFICILFTVSLIAISAYADCKSLRLFFNPPVFKEFENDTHEKPNLKAHLNPWSSNPNKI